MNNLIKDISALSNMPEDMLFKLQTLIEFNIQQCVFESIIEKNNLVEIDIGIGILYIKYEGESVKYKFIPSDKLEQEVNQVINSRKSPIMTMSTKQMVSRLQAAYKELI